MLRTCIILLGTLALAACASAAEPSKQIADFLGKDAVEILKAPEKVECFRINPMGRQEEDKEKKRVEGYEITGQAKDQDKAFAAKLSAVLFDEKTYDFEVAKNCMFTPGVVFRVWKGETFADVIVCFNCTELKVFAGGKGPEGAEDFDNARAALVALAKAAFPDDKTIQGLK